MPSTLGLTSLRCHQCQTRLDVGFRAGVLADSIAAWDVELKMERSGWRIVAMACAVG